jgi:hypothetical protein
MKFEQHLQFLIMMIPTLMLLAAAAATFGFSMKSAGEPVAHHGPCVVAAR